MRQVIFTLYRFDELPTEEAQACAVHAQRERVRIDAEMWDANCAAEELCETLRAFGVEKEVSTRDSVDIFVTDAGSMALDGVDSRAVRWMIINKFRKNGGIVDTYQDGSVLLSFKDNTDADKALLRPLNEFISSPTDRKFEGLINDCKGSLNAYLRERLEYVRSAEYIREFLSDSTFEFNKYGDQMDLPDFAREP